MRTTGTNGDGHGTWATGAFDNDTAADWCDDLDDAAADEREATVRDALVRVIDSADGDDTYLEAPDAEEAVARAALVAAQCPGGEAAHPHYGPEQPLPGLTALPPLALQALDRVMSEPSELRELWEGPGGGPWRAGIARMRGTLLQGPPGEQLGLC
ncbi:DUF4259 domain-containing protein [Streptomyces sp. NPDC007905]|uniref:DUF4259 domain-containing protein n=1 Tax=Streptomyces sp. NPDC007905 TaxID=3364788 RepID=UPI0036F1382B